MTPPEIIIRPRDFLETEHFAELLNCIAYLFESNIFRSLCHYQKWQFHNWRVVWEKTKITMDEHELVKMSFQKRNSKRFSWVYLILSVHNHLDISIGFKICTVVTIGFISESMKIKLYYLDLSSVIVSFTPVLWLENEWKIILCLCFSLSFLKCLV